MKNLARVCISATVIKVIGLLSACGGANGATSNPLSLVTLHCIDVRGRSLPVNYRVYGKTNNKTKNAYFQDMLTVVLAWGLLPAFATGDSRYSCKKNLKTVKNHQIGLTIAVEANRTVSVQKGARVQVQRLDVPAQGLMVWLRNFGPVKLFRTRLRDQLRHCHFVACLPDAQGYSTFGRLASQKLHDQHSGIEQYHRLLKQVYNAERFQVRSKVPTLNHFLPRCAVLCSCRRYVSPTPSSTLTIGRHNCFPQ